MNKGTGGPAFPCKKEVYEEGQGYCTEYHSGMDLLDYFAAKAMQTRMGLEGWSYEDVAKESYIIAKAMLAERDKEK